MWCSISVSKYNWQSVILTVGESWLLSIQHVEWCVLLMHWYMPMLAPRGSILFFIPSPIPCPQPSRHQGREILIPALVGTHLDLIKSLVTGVLSTVAGKGARGTEGVGVGALGAPYLAFFPSALIILWFIVCEFRSGTARRCIKVALLNHGWCVLSLITQATSFCRTRNGK